MDKIYKEGIAKQLKDKGVTLPCPRCGGSDFEIVEISPLQLGDNKRFKFYEKHLETVVVACSNCGFITLHVLACLNEEE